MKRIEIDPAIESNQFFAGLVERANELLEAELGRSSDQVSAAWELRRDPTGKELLRLTISDWSGRAEAGFSPDELMNERRAQSRIIRLWGDLLQIRSHKQLESFSGGACADQGGQETWDEIVDAVQEFSEKSGVEPHHLRLPIRDAVALMKLGPSFWGDFYQRIRQQGTRAFEGQSLLGMEVELVPGVDATLRVE